MSVKDLKNELGEPNKEAQITLGFEGEVLIKMTKDKFYYKGESIDDIHDVYGAMKLWLSKANGE